ncbi:MAG: hypothetical protein ACYDHW_06300 [Syntrophorhabdaceae bacterium]
MSMEQSMKEYCKILSLPVVVSCYQSEAESAVKAKLSYQEYCTRCCSNRSSSGSTTP